MTNLTFQFRALAYFLLIMVPAMLWMIAGATFGLIAVGFAALIVINDKMTPRPVPAKVRNQR